MLFVTLGIRNYIYYALCRMGMPDWICEQIEKGVGLPGKFYESDFYLGFLDPKPIAQGHGLLVPKRHVVTMDELVEEERRQFAVDYFAVQGAYRRLYGDFMSWVKDGPDAGQNLPHLHWHFYPRYRGDVTWQKGTSRLVLDTHNTFGFPRLAMLPSALEEEAAKLRRYVR